MYSFLVQRKACWDIPTVCCSFEAISRERDSLNFKSVVRGTKAVGGFLMVSQWSATNSDWKCRHPSGICGIVDYMVLMMDCQSLDGRAPRSINPFMLSFWLSQGFNWIIFCLTLSCPGMGRALVKIGHSNLRRGSKDLCGEVGPPSLWSGPPEGGHPQFVVNPHEFEVLLGSQHGLL